MEYFGTNLKEYGHYRWNLDGKFMTGGSIRFNDLPFHPEYLINYLPAGEVIFYQGGGFTVIGISGSCKDHRQGSKMIFWVKETISKPEMIERIKANPLAMELINATPFEINW